AVADRIGGTGCSLCSTAAAAAAAVRPSSAMEWWQAIDVSRKKLAAPSSIDKAMARRRSKKGNL
ncbi:hypothetical protein M513_03308, partial [Trichuris suis]